MVEKNILKNCINIHRLSKGGDSRELIGLEYLESHTIRCGNMGSTSNIESLKDMLLCMDKHDVNYSHLTEDSKSLVEKLIKNEDVVDIVLCTLFQWVGTNVGMCDVRKLIEDISKSKRKQLEVSLLSSHD